ncbi:ABC transporter [Bifidobacterium rousetti]|uniref:ATP-binding cassette domain-containing protein n=1 Tax=Bifidobacterium rousetti TaxID=2045439 RepID=UPI001239ED8A|nr:ATP-binding cassette domain-containing protein [Bifidobacterium rousetti]KAA8819631.1 ABC transporter [Bifidobacterium rousetti]
MPAISATNLSIGYKGSPIVNDINLQLKTGRIICLLGPNGAGKTTLMKTLLGRIRPVGGSVTYTRTSIDEMAAAIDHPSYFPYLSGRQNVQVASAFWGLDVDPESALNGVGIARAAHGRKAKDYSTGMKERLELCLAMLSHPRFLFLDEPQNGLDADGMISLTATLRAYRDAGNCVVISTHLLHEIQGVPDECIVIRHGRAVQIPDLTGVNIADLYHERSREVES